MIPGELIPIVIFICLTVMAIGTPIARAMARKIERGGPGSRELGGIEERLARLENAVDAIAVEVERISEGQRFTTKLLTDRGREPAALPAPVLDR
jgi:hypothetical protein